MSVTRNHDHQFAAVGFVADETRQAVCIRCGYRVPAEDVLDAATVPDHRLDGILLATRRARIAGRVERIGRLMALIVIGGLSPTQAVAQVRDEQALDLVLL